MKHIFLLSNEFTEFMVLGILKYEKICPEDTFIIYNARKYVPKYFKDSQILTLNAEAPILSNPTIKNITSKLRKSITFIHSIVGRENYIIYLPFVNQTKKHFITANCKEVRIYEEGFEAIYNYHDEEKHPFTQIKIYPVKHILKVAMGTRNWNAVRFFYGNYNYCKRKLIKAYKFSPIAYSKITQCSGVIDVKKAVDFSMDNLIKKAIPNKDKYIVLLSELFIIDPNRPDVEYDIEKLLLFLKNRLNKETIYLKGRLKDKEDPFEKVKSLIPLIKRFPETNDLLLDMKMGNVSLIVCGISSLMVYATQMNVPFYMCPTIKTSSNFSQLQNKMSIYINKLQLI